jgi:hypothetical protein
LDEKRFSLFNTGRWTADVNDHYRCVEAPELFVVPVIGRGEELGGTGVEDALHLLRTVGSLAADGFDNPEGIVVFHPSSNSLFKSTLDNNDAHKETVEVSVNA